jgi:hypothetical protein
VKKIGCFVALVLSLSPLTSRVQAGEIKWQKSPIETHWSFWGMDYTLAGQKLENFNDLSDVLEPQNDPEITRLLSDAREKGSVGEIGRLVGTLGVGWGGGSLLFNDSASSHSAHVAVLLSGVGLDFLASLFLDDSRAEKYNAVQRYNALVRGEDSSLPAPPSDEKSLLPSAK